MKSDVSAEAAANMSLLLDELANQCTHWKLRGFTEKEIVSVLGSAGMRVLANAGVFLEDAMKALTEAYAEHASTRADVN